MHQPSRRRNGHIGLIVNLSVYANVSTTDYVSSKDPGPYAQHGPVESAGGQANANTIHKEGRRIYNLDENVDAALKQ